ncbi:unnamed protein product [Ceratitis capitata]|uniref:(Mediterranean fruit fly) hypothetical protein n=1 Tax=Ceratitis capitata TaxID=7213 RepID=A0A811V481_CERCA|nr:unnamed protein product [Ceratitis capitata]
MLWTLDYRNYTHTYIQLLHIFTPENYAKANGGSEGKQPEHVEQTMKKHNFSSSAPLCVISKHEPEEACGVVKMLGGRHLDSCEQSYCDTSAADRLAGIQRAGGWLVGGR